MTPTKKQNVNATSVQFFDDDISGNTRRKKRKPNNNPAASFTLDLIRVDPKTENQELVFDHYEDEYNLLLHGTPGTGKTFLSLYLSLEEILQPKSIYSKVVVIRSIVAGRDIGFLPGNQKEKARVYEAPYVGICSELFERGDAYEILSKRGIIQFETTSFLRGTTLRDCIVIIDEFQNMSDQELHTIVTRLGENSRVIIAGDTKQDDLTGKKREVSGAGNLIRVIDEMKSFKTIRFTPEDIVRSEIVREWILAREKLNL